MNPLEIIQNNPQLEDVPVNQLAWLVEKSEIRELSTDELLFQKGDPVEYLQIMLEGRVSVYFLQNGQKRDMGILELHDITGVLPYSRLKESMAYGLALEQSKVLRLHKKYFEEMISNYHELTAAFVHFMTSRVREFTKQQQMNEKLVSLGKLSAGLAHELNNPASAVVRSSVALKKHLSNTPERFKKVMEIKVTNEQVDKINELLFNHISVKKAPLSLIAQNTLEDELLDWLEDNQVTDAFEIVSVLVEFQFQVEDLEKVKEIVSAAHTDAVINWIANNLITEKIVGEIEEASQRISHLINSIKSYSHLDKATDKSKTDLREGIQNTLTLLNHKLKTKHIEVEQKIPLDLPKVNAYVGELNQVWTNIIDNAIDAMPDKGKLEISSRQDREFVITDITDNGEGIPENMLSQIFDPFFTTKEIGKGTGLGLDIVQRIIATHNGSVKVQSQSGKTTFSICLPID